MAFKPRIVITIVDDRSSSEFSMVKGRELANGLPAPAPSVRHHRIARKAILDLLGVKPRKKS